MNQSQFAEEMLDYTYYKAKKKFKIPLDKVVKMWYNELTVEGLIKLAPKPRRVRKEVKVRKGLKKVF